MAFPRVHADGQEDQECDGDHSAEVGEEHEQGHEQVGAYDGLGGDVFVFHHLRGLQASGLWWGSSAFRPKAFSRSCMDSCPFMTV